MQETLAQLRAEKDEWKDRALKAEAIIEQHNLCHNLQGKVGPCEFAAGCAQEQRRLYGKAPDADALEMIRKIVNAKT